MSISSRVELIKPEKAQKYLKFNVNNRLLSDITGFPEINRCPL